MGTPDANPAPANSTGYVRVDAIAGNPGTSADEADVRVTVNITDVRWASDISDYTGELRAILPLRITDQSNGPTLADAATVSDTSYGVTVPCASTPSNAVGSTCSVVTTADALAPGTVLEGRRAMWQLGQVDVTDGGADGVASTAPNTRYMRQGVFVP